MLTILTALHIVKSVFSGLEFNQLSVMVFVSFFIAIARESRSLYSVSFILQGIMMILTMDGDPNLGPVVVFFLALFYRPDMKTLSSAAATIAVSFVIKSYFISSWTNSQTLEIVLAHYVFLSMLYFLFIKQPSDIDYLSRTTPLTARQLIILKYLHQGISRKKMPDMVPDKELWRFGIETFSLDVINYEISKIKTSLDLKSEFELGAWYESHIKNNRFNTNN